MKKFCMLVGLAAVLSGFALQAATVTLYQDSSTGKSGSYSWSNGGEFRAMPSAELSWIMNNYDAKAKNALSEGGFQTFCIEYNEHFYPGVSYNVTISDRAMYGSSSIKQYPNGDPISIGTAWLYRQFATGQLSTYDYDYGSDRVASAGALQQAIWFLEEEPNGANNALVQLAASTLGLTVADLMKDEGTRIGTKTYEYSVRALNLWSSDSVHNQSTAIQDQLVVVPEPTTMIAGALLLLPFGVSTVRVLRRNRRV